MEGGTCLSRGKFLTTDNAQLYHLRLDEDERKRNFEYHFLKYYYKKKKKKNNKLSPF